MITVRIDYVAMLREQAGRASESRNTNAATAEAVYRETQAAYTFTIPVAALRVAINDRMANWTDPVRDGDRLVFLPPSSGG
ncbi:MAG TPA: MoaD/ThiS family protein [Kiritimatiellia bacterium]|nr:MoaD/ThiS family protein [Kiritimatiellia bacterium]HMO97821.1 MoaD/ThiS family protein [Kiritimatiellia bacterium]HMP96432.1 MoaD/ThiS family protein [Kiritimatiellia bacterium]